MAAIPISSVTSPLLLNGGQVITIAGTFPAADPMSVYLGPNGDATDELCYVGVIGGGSSQQVEAGVAEITVISPPQTRGTHKLTIISDGGDSGVHSGVEVIEHPHETGVFEMRKTWPPWVDTGPRTIENEPRQDT